MTSIHSECVTNTSERKFCWKSKGIYTCTSNYLKDLRIMRRIRYTAHTLKMVRRPNSRTHQIVTFPQQIYTTIFQWSNIQKKYDPCVFCSFHRCKFRLSESRHIIRIANQNEMLNKKNAKTFIEWKCLLWMVFLCKWSSGF